jgi:hypothetical protein
MNVALIILACLVWTAILVVVISFIAHKLAPKLVPYADKGWEVHCRTCGWKHDALALGIVRVRAYSRGKRILGKCPCCKKYRMLALERTGPH